MRVGNKFLEKETKELVVVTDVDSFYVYYEFVDGGGEGECMKHKFLEWFSPVLMQIGGKK